MRRFAVALVFVLAVAALTTGSAGSRTSTSAFQMFVELTTSASSNGLRLNTEFVGSFDAGARTVDARGSYEVIAGATELEHGTFTLTSLVTFQFYGCGEVTTPDGTVELPPDFCGGRAVFTFHSTSSEGVERDGLLEVNCQIHDPGGQAPPGTSEGVKANVRGVNFHIHVTGDNLFVMQP